MLVAMPRFWVALAMGIGVFVLAAKVHGRHVRLERELAGHFSVRFGAPNDPFVEALWAQDRTQLWTIVGVGLAALVVAAWLGRAPGRLPLPLPGAPHDARWRALLVFGPIAVFVIAFAANAATSLIRFVSAAPAGGTPFTDAALRGSAAWIVALVVAGAVASATIAGYPRVRTQVPSPVAGRA